jgi:pimeloyl-ACP methyl ester carboxylesterase
MYRFVLVHGAWHDGGLWAPVATALRRMGHEVHTPTMAGNGKDADRNVDHAACTASILDHILDNDLGDFVLVGHSYGGTIIAKLAEVMPERIRRLVFWIAFVPLDGQSLTDNVPPPHVALFDQLAAASPDHTVTLPFPVWREVFINDADLELAQSSYAKLSPQPYRPLTDKLDLKKFHALTTPRSFLNCTEDTALPPGEWGWHPRMSGRLGLCRLVQMPGSHEVLFTNPEGLAVKLVEAGRD